MDEIRKELMDLMQPVRDIAGQYDSLIARFDALMNDVMRRLDQMQLLATQRHEEMMRLTAERHDEIMRRLQQIADANDGRNDLLETELKGFIQ